METQELSILNLCLERYGNQIIDLYRRQISNASGKLGNSLNCFVDTEDGIYNLYIQLEDYWKYLEYGRQPGSFPNIEAIKKWIQIKPVIPRGTGKLPNIEELTYLISRSIANKGIEPRSYLTNILNNLDFSDLKDSVTKDVTNRFDIILKNNL